MQPLYIPLFEYKSSLQAEAIQYYPFTLKNAIQLERAGIDLTKGDLMSIVAVLAVMSGRRCDEDAIIEFANEFAISDVEELRGILEKMVFERVHGSQVEVVEEPTKDATSPKKSRRNQSGTSH